MVITRCCCICLALALYTSAQKSLCFFINPLSAGGGSSISVCFVTTYGVKCKLLAKKVRIVPFGDYLQYHPFNGSQ